MSSMIIPRDWRIHRSSQSMEIGWSMESLLSFNWVILVMVAVHSRKTSPLSISIAVKILIKKSQNYSHGPQRMCQTQTSLKNTSVSLPRGWQLPTMRSYSGLDSSARVPILSSMIIIIPIRKLTLTKLTLIQSRWHNSKEMCWYNSMIIWEQMNIQSAEMSKWLMHRK